MQRDAIGPQRAAPAHPILRRLSWEGNRSSVGQRAIFYFFGIDLCTP